MADDMYPSEKTMTRMSILVAAAVLAPIASAFASVAGGAGGIVGLQGVGPLYMNVSEPAAVELFAGKPSRVIYQTADNDAATAADATVALYFYGHDSTTYAFFRAGGRWRLSEFMTTRRVFRTPAGTRVGMTYKQAAAREHVKWSGGCVGAGFWHYGKDVTYLVDVNPGQRVTSLAELGANPPPC